LATKPKAGGWSNNLRRGFNLEAENEEASLETEATSDPAKASPSAIPAEVAGTEYPLAKAAVDLVPLTSSAPARERGRPKSTLERFPKTIYLVASAELGLRRVVEQMQEWRGRRRGVLKVQESEAANFALEYLYRRMNQGVEVAEAYYQECRVAERTRFEPAKPNIS